VIDTAGIQKYIFGSNSLQHNIGASGLVHCATHDWVFEGLMDLGETNINRIDNKIKIDSKKGIENDSLNSELIYAGGGNAIIVFRTIDLAIKFTQNLTFKVLLEAPGLQLIISHSDFDWDTQSLSKKIDDTMWKVNQKKMNHEHSRPLLGLGVTVDCQYTGLPANDFRLESKRDEKKKYISSEVGKKLDFFHMANDRLNSMIPKDQKQDIEFTYNFNDFGTKHESSYIAVIHTDGNGMGNRIKKIARIYKEEIKNKNRNYINDIRAFSKSIEDTAEKALRATIKQIFDSITENGKIGGKIEIRDRIPFRPIVFGGDDVTFVCDGRMGLSLAHFYLNQLTSTKLSDKDFLYARAGVVVVKSHHPFSRAVALAEELAETAKKYIKDQKKTLGEENLSAIDWHFASSGPIGKLSDIRQREYTVKFDNNIDGKLNMRPLRLGNSDKDWHSWETFTAIIKELNQKKWSEKHNKLIGLREPLRFGPEVVQQYLQINKLPDLYSIPGDPGSAKTGWVANDCCTCFDAIEALEYFVTLEGDK
jgi:hypothetical protein